MMQELKCVNKVDESNNPTGGSVEGVGIRINWQEGPLGIGPKRIPPNGAFVEGVILAAIQRIEFFQESRFKCLENTLAVAHLQIALAALNARTDERKARNVEGMHKQ